MNPSKSFEILWYWLAVIAFVFLPHQSSAEQPPVSIEIQYAQESGHPVALLWLTPNPGYYTYAHASDADMPTTVRVFGPDGHAATATVSYPQGVLRPDLFEPGKEVLAYAERVPVAIRFDLPATDEALTAEITMLLCSSKNCIPVTERLRLAPPRQLAPLEGDALTAYKALIPATQTDDTPAQNEENAPSQQNVSMAPTAAPTSNPALEQEEWQFTPRFPQEGLEPATLGAAILLGIAAGLLLNVMPCVLPVLTMKISALLCASGHASEKERIRHFREHNILFALGILTWFLVLAFLVGVLGLAWGGLFQQTQVVYGLLILVFLLGLSMFDVFTLPVLDFKVGASGMPRTQAYTTGLVATLLATPCSGPLLGGVLSWAALQPLHVVVVIFLATGTGMALPYLVMAAWPAASRILPRPGAWNGVMERLVGFFLMGTAIYLLSILPESRRLSTLAALLVIGLAAWLWGRWGGLRASIRQKIFTGVIAALMVGGAVWWSVQPAPSAPWQTFQADSFRSLLRKEPLLVEFTADWCPSCKFLEQTVLTPRTLTGLRERYGLRLIKVDLTRPDAEAQALLRAIGSVSIPVTAIFPAGDAAGSPIVLRDLYTAEQLENALNLLPSRK